MENDFSSILEKFSQLNVIVIGEAILDSSVRGTAGRLSLEAPVPVVEIQDGQEAPGGAANVAVNACRLGANVEMISVIGEDADGDQLLSKLRAEGIAVRRVIRHPQRRTLLKRRIYAADQLVVRYDNGSTEPVDEATGQRLLEELKTLCRQADVIILADYGQGLLTRPVLAGIAQIQAEQACMLVADTRRLDEYRGLRLAALRPSYHSAMEMLEGEALAAVDSQEQLSEAGERILERLDTQMVAITLDDDGALVLDRDMPSYRTYAPRAPFNRVSGAGDAFISGLALSLAAGATAAEAGEIASAVASIVIGKGGQAACCIDELRASLGGDRKLVEDWDTLEMRLDALRREGKKIVFTNGVFDILHSAHVAYLNQARSYGDILVIGVNTDESVRRLKGPTRPINGLIERCRVLAGLSCVDFVVPFGEDNPINLVHHVRPDVYVKGGDYTRETLPEAAVVESYGGELRLVAYIANHSTTGVIERIRKMDGAK
jgi:D-beta-D-heptose 7-phosphate kinase / D-beta-D-heptose 1-phosphate adenosyltransferase